MTEWYESLFDERYPAFYDVLDRHPAATQDVAFLERALDLEPGMAVLDLGCGQGRHAVPLAARGYQVTGLDLSETMLARAKRLADEMDTSATWLHRRMEELDDLGPFDAVLCLYTVLGYYGDVGDLAVLGKVRDVLRPGACLALDLSNFPLTICQSPGERWQETTAGVTREAHRYDPLTGFLHSERTLYRREGGVLRLPDSAVRAYPPHEVLRMLRAAGLEPELLFGAYDDVGYEWRHSTHQLHVARRPPKG